MTAWSIDALLERLRSNPESSSDSEIFLFLPELDLEDAILRLAWQLARFNNQFEVAIF